MRLIVTLAIGEPYFGELSLNLSASIKAQTPNQKILLIYNETAVNSIKPLMDKFFDYGLMIYDQKYSNPAEMSFYLKTQLYGLVSQAVPDADEILFLDADTIMVPGRTVDEWFDKHKGKPFAAYCNDVFDYSTNKRRRKDYTFWADVQEIKKYHELADTDKLPQINSSFLYFNKSLETEYLFRCASNVWNDEEMKFQGYKGVKPDELCFNIACAIGGIMPAEKPTYRPIFFQFASETQSVPYMLHYFKSFGFAGVAKPANYIIDFYNEVANYYRSRFGLVNNFQMRTYTKAAKDEEQMRIKPVSKKSLYRAGDLENGDCGIFNPDGLVFNDGSIMTIYRKEPTMDAYKANYTHSTGVAHVHILKSLSDSDGELIPVGFDGERLEDFRLFNMGALVMCNHKIIYDGHWERRDMTTCLSIITGNQLVKYGVPELPFERRRIDINWVFFVDEENVWCIYQLFPYTILRKLEHENKWEQLDAPQPPETWFHKGNYICNSTNPVLIGDHYLMFFHTKESGIYYHGAALIDKTTKHLAYTTKNSIEIKHIDKVDGLHKHLLYVSGCVYFADKDIVRVYFGEADSHSSQHDYKGSELIELIINNSK